uniref:Putative secreted protein n=1 Tax=Anopheles darlingi TaxID=43151 RepID=A0A2M4DBP3_ANODA
MVTAMLLLLRFPLMPPRVNCLDRTHNKHTHTLAGTVTPFTLLVLINLVARTRVTISTCSVHVSLECFSHNALEEGVYLGNAIHKQSSKTGPPIERINNFPVQMVVPYRWGRQNDGSIMWRCNQTSYCRV